MQSKLKQSSGVLDLVNSPEDLKKISTEYLNSLASEIRENIIDVVSNTGGHLGANLGIVELTIALHYLLDSPKDKIVWDVGHQCYVHKILTGRKDKLSTIRQTNGLSGFPNVNESVHDHFNVGHASTSISQAVGLAAARDLKGDNGKVVAVLGDGSLTGGMCYEAMNNVGHLKSPMTIILNDNKMAISKSIGSMSRYLNKIISAPLYNRVRAEIERKLEKLPAVVNFLKHSEESLKNLLVPGIVFEELGIRYFGPIDGHDIPLLLDTLSNVFKLNVPCLLHVITKKGKGYKYAENAPHKYHSAAPFDVLTGKPPEADACVDFDGDCLLHEKVEPSSYTKVFSDSIIKLAAGDKSVVAITAAMPEGTGLVPFQEKYPERFFDVGIAEEHAVTFSGALSKGGMKPVCAIYSTFLQRGYDQLIHDIALQDLSVTFCLDRAGLVGADGPTHHGIFDFAFLRTVPNSIVAAPCNKSEMYRMLELSLGTKGVFSLRYPKTCVSDDLIFDSDDNFDVGQGEVLRDGADVLILTLGHMVSTALEVVDKLKEFKIEATLCNMRFVKPLDGALLSEKTKAIKHVVTIEEHVECGGFGSAVAEFFIKNNMFDVMMKICALPDSFIEHGSRDYLLKKYRLSKNEIADDIKEFLNK